MNLFKSLLFLEGYITNPRLLDDDFGPSYGNRHASERSFRDGFSQLEFARHNATPEPCSQGGCG